MTPDTTKRIAQIRAAAQRVLELSEKAMPAALARATLTLLDCLQRVARPALGGKMQQYDAQAALEKLAADWPGDAL